MDSNKNNTPSKEDSQGNSPSESIFVDVETEAAKNIVDDVSEQKQKPQELSTIGQIDTTDTLNETEISNTALEAKPYKATKLLLATFLNKIGGLNIRNKPLLTKKRMSFMAIIFVVTVLFIGGAYFNTNKQPKVVALDSKISISGVDVSEQILRSYYRLHEDLEKHKRSSKQEQVEVEYIRLIKV